MYKFQYEEVKEEVIFIKSHQVLSSTAGQVGRVL